MHRAAIQHDIGEDGHEVCDIVNRPKICINT